MDTLTAMVIVHGMVVHILRKILIKYVKYFRWLYTLYYWVGSLVVNVLKILVKPRNNLILFISYGGRKFDDSPRQIYEGMIRILVLKIMSLSGHFAIRMTLTFLEERSYKWTH